MAAREKGDLRTLLQVSTILPRIQNNLAVVMGILLAVLISSIFSPASMIADWLLSLCNDWGLLGDILASFILLIQVMSPWVLLAILVALVLDTVLFFLSDKRHGLFETLKKAYWWIFFGPMDFIFIGPKKNRNYYGIPLKNGEYVEHIMIPMWLSYTFVPMMVKAGMILFFWIVTSFVVGLGIMVVFPYLQGPIFDFFYMWSYVDSFWSYMPAAGILIGVPCFLYLVYEYLLIEWERLHRWLLLNTFRAWVVWIKTTKKWGIFPSREYHVSLTSVKDFRESIQHGGWGERIFKVGSLFLPSRAVGKVGAGGVSASDHIVQIRYPHSLALLIEKLISEESTVSARKADAGGMTFRMRMMDAARIQATVADVLDQAGVVVDAQTQYDSEVPWLYFQQVHPKGGSEGAPDHVVLWDPTLMTGPYGDEIGKPFTRWQLWPTLAPLSPQPATPHSLADSYAQGVLVANPQKSNSSEGD